VRGEERRWKEIGEKRRGEGKCVCVGEREAA